MIAIIQQKRKRPSLTPLIDVVFLLLIFFMIVSRLSLEQMQELSLPSTGASNASISEEQKNRLALTLNADGSLGLDGKSISAAEFLNSAALNAEKHVDLSLGEDVTLQQTLTLIEQLSATGFTKVKLQVQEQPS